MKKYKFIGILMVMAGTGNLLSALLDELNHNIPLEPQHFYVSAVAIVLGFYILRLANQKSIV